MQVCIKKYSFAVLMGIMQLDIWIWPCLGIHLGLGVCYEFVGLDASLS